MKWSFFMGVYVCVCVRWMLNLSSFIELFFYLHCSAVAIATIVVLFVITGIVILIKYLIRTHRRRTLRSSVAKVNFFFLINQWTSYFFSKQITTPNAPPPPPAYLSTAHHSTERDTLSNHIYEQCYEPPPYEVARKYPMTRTYYEHVLWEELLRY